MPLIDLITLSFGSRLIADTTVVGSIGSGSNEQPVYEVSRLIVSADARVRDQKTSGVLKARLNPEVLGPTGRLLELLNTKQSSKEYTLTARERLVMRGSSANGLPNQAELHWDRLVRGPMSPTIEQEVGRYVVNTGDGGTITITAPTTGNLLIIGHGYYWRGASPGEPTATGGGSTPFTRRGYAGSANFEVLQAILDRVSTGDEGTTITVTNGGTSEDNSSYFIEYSGMTSSPFVAISAGADGGSGDVTSVGSGTVDTTGIDDTLLFATFGHDGSPTGFGYTNSFVEEGSVNSGLGVSTHGTRVATRVVSAASTYSTTASWTTGVVASGIVAAYAIEVASAPTATVPSSGKCINTYAETAVPGISVATGTSAITAVATTATAGFTLTYDTTGTSVTIGANGTNAATLLNAASEEEWTTVLDTLTMRGTTSDTDCTVTVIPTDGTLNDSEQFTVICDPASITITGTNANVISAVSSLQIRLLPNQTHDTIEVTATDDGGSPQTSTSEFLIGLSSFFQSVSEFALRILMKRRRKNKSGN